MTSTPATILARIDDLILDLVRQVAVQTERLLSDSTTDAVSQSQQGDRPAKRSKQAAKPKIEPLRLPTFAAAADAADEAAERQEAPAVSNVSFPTKSVVGSASDRIISQLVTLLGVTDRLELGIVGSPRGILSGSLKLSSPSTSAQVFHCTFGQTTLIPTEIDDSWTIDLPCPHPLDHVLLIVEKEAVFKHLLQTTLPAQTILVTGKGYPDRATARLVHLFSNHRCSHCEGNVEVSGLFDGDPYGVDVWRQYRLHSPVKWVGVDVKDFAKDEKEGLVGLRNDERRTAVRLLRGLGAQQEEEEVRMRLTEMLLGGYKVEIEAAYEFVDSKGGEKGLVAYMKHKLARG